MLRAALIRIVYTTVMFLAGLVLSNLALPERFGSISLLTLNASLLTLITGFGVENLVLYKVSSKQWDVSKAFYFSWSNIFIQLIIFTLLESGCWLTFHHTLLSVQNADYFIIDAIYFSGLIIVEKYLSLFYALHKSKKANGILAIVASVYLLLLLLFYYFIRPAFAAVLYLFAITSLLQGTALIFAFGFNHSPPAQLERKEFWRTMKLSSVIMITNIVQLFAYRLDFWLLQFFYGSHEVGLYAQANKFANLVWIVPNIFAGLLLPKFGVLDNEMVKKIVSVFFNLNILILLATICCTQTFYVFFLSPEYLPGLSAFYLMLPGYFFWAAVIYFAAYISSIGRFSYNLLGSTLCLVFIFVADIILIPKYTIKGAAIANSIVYGSIFLGYLFLFKRRFSFKLRDLFWANKNAVMQVVKFITE